MFTPPSLLRLEEHKAFSSIKLSGRVLDLGGVRGAEYLSFLDGNFKTTTVNFGTKGKPDVVHDLEFPLPLEDSSYNHVLLINVLEHVFEYKNLLKDSARVLKPEGSVVIAVPFLFPIHPSPGDYHRFTREALVKELEIAGFRVVSIDKLAVGVFRVIYLMIDRLLPKILRIFNFFTFRYVVYFLDGFLIVVARLLGKKYNENEYVLGYCVVAKKT